METETVEYKATAEPFEVTTGLNTISLQLTN